MAQNVIIASSLRTEIDSSTGETETMLLKRLCARLEKAYRTTPKDRVTVIGAGSDYYEVESREELAAIHASDDLDESPLIDPLDYAAKMSCNWAIKELRERDDG